MSLWHPARIIPPTKEIWVAGNYDLVVNASRADVDYHPTIKLPDGVTVASVCYGFRVPNDFSSLLPGYPKLVLYSYGSGDVRIGIETRAGAVGQATGNRTDSIAEYTQAITAYTLT